MDIINIFLDTLLFSWIGIMAFVFLLLYIGINAFRFYDFVKNNAETEFNLLYLGVGLSYVLTFIIKLII